MSKAEEYIRKNTHIIDNPQSCWLTPNKALRAVEIAKEETTEEIKRLLKENYLIKGVEPLRWVSWEKVFDDIKQAMKDE